MCRVLEVSVSGYYASRGRSESEGRKEDRLLATKIAHYFDDSRGTYGTPRLKIDFAANGMQVSRHRIGRIINGSDSFKQL